MSLPREESAKVLADFYTTLWHNEDGYVYLPTKDSDSTWKKNFFRWPERKDDVVAWTLEQSATNKDVYCSPVIFKESGIAEKSNVKGSHTLWGDWDGEAPEWAGEGRERATDALPGVPPPTVRVQSSLDKREHLYWTLDEFNTDIEYVEQLNRRIAYSGNADTGCWNINRVLRPPETINTGNGKDRKALPVTLLETNSSRVTREDFSNLPTPRTLIKESIRSLKELPSLDTVLTGENWSEELLALFKADSPKSGDRSKALVRLSMMSAELGFSEESIYVLVDDADKRWGKYTDRSEGERNRLLINLVDRAKAKHPEAIPDMVWSPKVEVDQKTVYSHKELLEADMTIDWLIEDLLPESGLGIISAAPGLGKTLMSIDMAMNLAVGRDYLKWVVNREARVLYLSMEMPGPSFKYFLEKTSVNLTDEEKNKLNENFFIAPFGEMMIFKQKHVKDFITKIIKDVNPDVIFIDSLSQVMTDLQTDTEALAFFDEIHKMKKIHETSFIFVHHNKKPSENKPTTLADMYGSVFISGAVDFVLSLWKPAGNDQNLLRLELTKARLGPTGNAFGVSRREDLRYEIAEESSSFSESQGTAKYTAGPEGNLSLEFGV